MSVVAAIRRMLSSGMDLETALTAAEAFEAEAPEFVPALTPRQARNQRYYHKRLKASENKTDKTVSDASKTIKTVSDAEPRAHVRDITSNSEIPGSVVAVVERERDPPTDDWPEGNAQNHAKLLIAEIESPWLDPHKSLDLNTTIGRLAAWKREGASWQFDVLPVVGKLCSNRRSRIGSWKFFDAAIAQSIADNRAALAIPEATRATGPPNSLMDRMADERRQAETLAFQMLDAQNGRTN